MTARQAEYLRAMGIDVWMWRERGLRDVADDGAADATSVPKVESNLEPNFEPALEPRPGASLRTAELTATGLVVGPGNGSLLLICDGPADTSLPIAADIARCLAEEPVWGWPADSASAPGVPLEETVRDRMFTGVLAFGEAAAAAAGDTDKGVRGSARILRAASMAELAADPAARRTLWSQLRATDWCAPRRRDPQGR